MTPWQQFAVLALLALSPVGSAATLHIADGDVEALHAAFASANTSGSPSRIVLPRNGLFRLDRGLSLGNGVLTLEGNGATLVPSPTSGPSLIAVGQGATLLVERVVVDGSLLRNGDRPALPITDVSGSLLVRSSLFTRLLGPLQHLGGGGALLPMHRVTPEDSVRIENTTLYQVKSGMWRTSSFYPVWAVAGKLELDSTTLIEIASEIQRWPAIWAEENGTVAIRNSVEWNPAIRCSEGVSSLGGNVWSARRDDLAFGERQCIPDSDIVYRADGEEVPWFLPATPAPELRGGLTPTVQLPAAPFRAPIGSDCLPTDARGAVRPAQGCTPGALELNAQFGDSRLVGGEGGAGVWYDPENDGHYLQIQPLPDAQMLLTWMHFDRQGRPAWAYLVAASDGGRLAGAALRNRSIGATEGLHAAEAEPWGQLDVQFEDCDRLRLRYAGIDGGPGSGDVVLRRLTALPDVGCR